MLQGFFFFGKKLQVLQGKNVFANAAEPTDVAVLSIESLRFHNMNGNAKFKFIPLLSS